MSDDKTATDPHQGQHQVKNGVTVADAERAPAAPELVPAPAHELVPSSPPPPPEATPASPAADLTPAVEAAAPSAEVAPAPDAPAASAEPS